MIFRFSCIYIHRQQGVFSIFFFLSIFFIKDFFFINIYTGLNYPGFIHFLDKNQLEKKEEELVERFYMEMRKPPVEIKA